MNVDDVHHCLSKTELRRAFSTNEYIHGVMVFGFPDLIKKPEMLHNVNQ